MFHSHSVPKVYFNSSINSVQFLKLSSLGFISGRKLQGFGGETWKQRCEIHSLLNCVNEILIAFCTYFVLCESNSVQIIFAKNCWVIPSFVNIGTVTAVPQRVACTNVCVCTVRICCVVWVKLHVQVLDLHIILLMECELYFLMGINEIKCTCMPCTMWRCKTKKCLRKIFVLESLLFLDCLLLEDRTNRLSQNVST
jgi:hypothetical protein